MFFSFLDCYQKFINEFDLITKDQQFYKNKLQFQLIFSNSNFFLTLNYFYLFNFVLNIYLINLLNKFKLNLNLIEYIFFYINLLFNNSNFVNLLLLFIEIDYFHFLDQLTFKIKKNIHNDFFIRLNRRIA